MTAPVVFFFGRGDYPGHRLHDSLGQTAGFDWPVPWRKAGLYPWDDHRREQPEGVLWYWQHPHKPVTLLLSWDRSGDKRGNSVATFIIHDRVTAERGLELARSMFPGVFRRIESHLGRPVELGGEAEV